MSIAYVITAHQNARQLLRMLHAISAPDNVYILHIDAKADRSVHDAARDFAADHPRASVIRSEPLMWGSWRIARAQIRGMKEALRIADDWNYCINLTGQDYPLHTQHEIARRLESGPMDANYVQVLDFATASTEPRKRLEFYWMPWRGKMTKVMRRRRPLPFRVYWGSNWITLTRPACEYLTCSDLANKMLRAFRFTLCADELIFQTTLMHSPFHDTLISKNFRAIDWTGGWHPRTYTLADLSRLLNSDALFARKFDDTIDSNILDAIDDHLKRPVPALAG